MKIFYRYVKERHKVHGKKKRRKKENCRAKNATHVAILERTLQKSDDQRSAETCKQLLAAERKNIESILFKNSFSEQIKPKKKINKRTIDLFTITNS